MMSTGQVSFLGLLLCSIIVGLASQSAKSGQCPPERNIAPTFRRRPLLICSNDSDCDGNQKCCLDNLHKVCKPPALERSGNCVSVTSSSTGRSDDYCSSDSECADGSKCCLSTRGKTCVPSVGEKKGFCRQEEKLICLLDERKFCDSDTSCSGDEKCCPYLCHVRCQKPVPERVGQCPASESTSPVTSNYKQCSSDADCTKLHKCCPTQSESQCLEAVNVPSFLH